MEQAENPEKGPRWSWARNPMGNPKLKHKMKINHLFSAVLVGSFGITAFFGFAVAEAQGISGFPVSVSSNVASNGVDVSQNGTIVAGQQDFTALGPDSIPLFDIYFNSNNLCIIGLRNYSVPANDYIATFWQFSLPSDGLTFSGASLVSSSLFSNPPLEAECDPFVYFDPTSDSITVDILLESGPANATVNAGGSTVVSVSVVPEPSALCLLTFGILAGVFLTRKTLAV